MSPELRTELDRAADGAPLTDRDLGPAAWYAARAARRRRRLSAAAAVVVLAGTGWAVTNRAGTPPPPAPASTATATRTALDLQPDVVGGLVVRHAVAPGAEAALPRLPAELGSSLPARIEVDPGTVIARRSDLGQVTAKAAAVLLRRVSGGYHPVVLLEPAAGQGVDAPGRYVELDAVLLVPFDAGTPDPHLALGPRVIAPDGRRLAFLQPGEVVGVDLVTGAVDRVPLPDRHVVSGGWTGGDVWFLAWSPTGQWRVDPFTGTVQPVAETVYDGRGWIQPAPAGPGADLVTFSDDGVALYQRELSPWLADPWNDTVTSSAGWSASGSFLSAEAQVELAGSQGLVAAQTSGLPHLLVASPEDTVKGCCTALGWASPTVLLYSSATAAVPTGPVSVRLLAWEVTSGRQWFVADLPSGQLPNGDVDTRVGALLPQLSLAQHP